MAFWNTILDLIFPKKCLSCNKNGDDFCIDCLGQCEKNGRVTAEWIHSVFDYRDPRIKKAIWLLKYKKNKGLAKTFSVPLYEKILEELMDLENFNGFKNPILIPIPLSLKRKRERGFNQAELLVEEIIKIDTEKTLTPCLDVLKRSKDTKHQARIENRRERIENAFGVFEVNKNQKIKDQNIILIDDVTTTGATLEEARRILKTSGAKKVVAFTLAH